MTEPVGWEERLRRQRREDRAILLSWGLAVLMLAGLFSFWIWHNQRQQDRALCAVFDLFTSGPAVAGPAGDRGRVILKAISEWQRTAGCDAFRPKLPTSPR